MVKVRRREMKGIWRNRVGNGKRVWREMQCMKGDQTLSESYSAINLL